MSFNEPKYNRPPGKDPDYGFLEERLIRQKLAERDIREFAEILRNANVSSTKPRQTTRVIPSFSGTFIITYIGGPKNGTQEFLEARQHPHIQDGQVFRTSVFENPGLKPQDSHNSVHDYKIVFIPQTETRFTDDICIVAVYQA